MNDWRPINVQELREEIDRGFEQMSDPQKRLWNAIKIAPQKWQLQPWGDAGGGFWVVAVLGQTVVWFNDIEFGFNRSGYNQFGAIREYHCNQDELNSTVQHLLNEVQTGTASGEFLEPPQAI